MKKLSILFIIALVTMTFTGCSNNKDEFDANKEIVVVTREDGSGTRGEFIELFGIEKRNGTGTITIIFKTNQ